MGALVPHGVDLCTPDFMLIWCRLVDAGHTWRLGQNSPETWGAVPDWAYEVDLAFRFTQGGDGFDFGLREGLVPGQEFLVLVDGFHGGMTWTDYGPEYDSGYCAEIVYRDPMPLSVRQLEGAVEAVFAARRARQRRRADLVRLRWARLDRLYVAVSTRSRSFVCTLVSTVADPDNLYRRTFASLAHGRGSTMPAALVRLQVQVDAQGRSLNVAGLPRRNGL